LPEPASEPITEDVTPIEAPPPIPEPPTDEPPPAEPEPAAPIAPPWEETKATPNVFTGPSLPEMVRFVRAIDKVRYDQHQKYVAALLKVRACLDTVLAGTSKPLQLIGGLNKVSGEARAKYQSTSEAILRLKPPYPIVLATGGGSA
jgi:hypothetical protein